MDVPEEQGIYFDSAGALWYTHKVDKVPITGELLEGPLLVDFC